MKMFTIHKDEEPSSIKVLEIMLDCKSLKTYYSSSNLETILEEIFEDVNVHDNDDLCNF